MTFPPEILTDLIFVHNLKCELQFYMVGSIGKDLVSMVVFIFIHKIG